MIGQQLPLKILARLVAAQQPPPLPDNSPLNQFVGPTEESTWTDTITVTIAPNGQYYTPYVKRIGSASDWGAGAGTNVDVTSRPGSIILAANQTSGSLVSPSQQIPYVVSSGATMTVSWNDQNFSVTSDMIQIRWSSDGVSWGAWSMPLINEDAVTVSNLYYQFLITLSTSNSALSPQFNTIIVRMANWTLWGGMSWK